MAADIEELGRKHWSRIVIEVAAPGRRAEIIVTPSGRVLPCAEAASVPELECWSVRDRPLAEICIRSPAFSALRDGALRAAPLLAPDLATAQDAAAYTYRRM
jgi:hypothetical protein